MIYKLICIANSLPQTGSGLIPGFRPLFSHSPLAAPSSVLARAAVTHGHQQFHHQMLKEQGRYFNAKILQAAQAKLELHIKKFKPLLWLIKSTQTIFYWATQVGPPALPR